jgi:hypothetical protein
MLTAPQSDGPPAAGAPPAATPGEAVEEFVAAEVAGDAGRAWSLLAADDRSEVRTPAAWRAAHQHLPRFRSVQLEGPPAVAAGSRAELHGTVSFEPALDEVRGLVPATARATWVTIAEDGGWRVAYDTSSFEPVVPDDASGARTAVAEWVAARQRAAPVDGACPRPSQEWSGGLVGVPGLANRLCGAAGTAQVGEPRPFDRPTDATALIAAFGPEVLTWSRVVEISAPVTLQAVTAPLGDRWLVIGALLAEPTGS